MFESGLDFSGWGLEEWLISGGVLLLLLVIILIMVMKPGNQIENKAPDKTKSLKNAPMIEPVQESKEMPKVEPAMEPKVVEKPVEVTPVQEEKAVDTMLHDEPVEATSDENTKVQPVKKDLKEGPAKYHISQNKETDAEHASEWRVRKEGSTKTIKYFKTQKEAIAFAEKLAENQDSSIVIHKKDGSIRKQDYTKK